MFVIFTVGNALLLGQHKNGQFLYINNCYIFTIQTYIVLCIVGNAIYGFCGLYINIGHTCTLYCGTLRVVVSCN